MIVLKHKHIENVIAIASKQQFENTDTTLVNGIIIESNSSDYKTRVTQRLTKSDYKDITSEYLSRKIAELGVMTIPKGYKGELHGYDLLIEPDTIYLKCTDKNLTINNLKVDIFTYIKKDRSQETVITQEVFHDKDEKDNLIVHIIKSKNDNFDKIKPECEIIDEELFNSKLNECKEQINKL